MCKRRRLLPCFKPNLPRHLLHYIFQFVALDVGTLTQLELTCKIFNRIINSPNPRENLWGYHFSYYGYHKSVEKDFALLKKSYATHYQSNQVLDLNIVLIGYEGCGKSSICERFCNDKFSDTVEFIYGEEYRKQTKLGSYNANMNLLLAFVGEDKHKALFTESYLRECDACIIVLSLDDPNSIRAVDTFYTWLLKTKETYRFPAVIAINKTDLANGVDTEAMIADEEEEEEEEDIVMKEVDSSALLDVEQVKQIAKKYGNLPVLETSAKTGDNVKELFATIGTQVMSMSRIREGTKSSSESSLSKCVIS